MKLTTEQVQHEAEVLGRYHWAHPDWMCITKRWANKPNGSISWHKGKSITLKDPDGKLFKFKTRVLAAKYFDMKADTFTSKISQALKRESNRIKCNGKSYIIVVDKEDDE